jgi:hypothetical protein
MNTQTTNDRNANNPAANKAIAFNATPRRNYGERRFGVGYGRSSGYASDKRYTTDWGQIRFRCT